jgi:hypothetical protein
MDVTSSSELLVDFQWTTQRNIPEDCKLVFCEICGYRGGECLLGCDTGYLKFDRHFR